MATAYPKLLHYLQLQVLEDCFLFAHYTYWQDYIIDNTQIYQRRLSSLVMKKMGYDFESGRLDVSGHPFATTLDRYNVDKCLERLDLGTILSWLNTNIHQHGSFLWPPDLVKQATGEELNPQYFIDYLNKKYSKIYNF